MELFKTIVGICEILQFLFLHLNANLVPPLLGVWPTLSWHQGWHITIAKLRRRSLVHYEVVRLSTFAT
jgi:hypothetical protein